MNRVWSSIGELSEVQDTEEMVFNTTEFNFGTMAFKVPVGSHLKDFPFAHAVRRKMSDLGMQFVCCLQKSNYSLRVILG